MAGIEATLRRHRRIGLDTSPFIYQIEEHPLYGPLVGSIFADLASGVFEGITTVITLMELCVKPLQLDRRDVADDYERLLVRFPHLSVVRVNRAIARLAAELRATHRLRPADALQVAACIQHGGTAFITNDSGLRRVTTPEVLILDDFLDT